ncbi:hypothetical protein [uncultured Nevskia sp.]|uniref:hypothetical protein n=1 Tax=uncultured Nevskia sp. TaxID=228950 RepID=UPI0025FB759A|nr:hypothetical protein [uncultured Nevskia sp.]
MLTKGDDYPIHQTAEPIAYAGTDRNFYDRYFFNGYNPDGSVFFAAALGVYPLLNVMDAAFCIVVDGVQHNLHASRHLRMERMDTQVGPISVDVVVPLQQLRVRVDSAEHGIRADILFSGYAEALEEPRYTRRNGPRMFMDLTRLTQQGHYRGWIEVQGNRIVVDGMTGTRDRSWGVRPIGMADPQPMDPPNFAQFHWLWSPLHFDDCYVLYNLNADEHGEPWNVGAVIGRNGKHVEHLRNATSTLRISSGTRHADSASFQFVHRNGDATRIDLSVKWPFFMTGLGYFNPDWAHGLNKGPLAVGYDQIRTADIRTHLPPYSHIQAFVSATMTGPDGQVSQGFGVLEQLLIGPYSPLGMTGLLDPMP